MTLLAGQLLCLISDGVTEAQNEAGELYGGVRAERLFAGIDTRSTAASAVVEALRADVEVFAAGVEPADDITILALRWNGAGDPVSAR
jgi:serine phosphatase RsbU (regulator of sigma subunit)